MLWEKSKWLKNYHKPSITIKTGVEENIRPSFVKKRKGEEAKTDEAVWLIAIAQIWYVQPPKIVKQWKISETI